MNSGAAEPGVILAFLIYFNLILHSAMSFNRIFLLLSKAAASADRIAEVLRTPEDQPVLPEGERREKFGAAFQGDIIFAESIRENITLGRELTDQEVLRAAEDARLRQALRERYPGATTIVAAQRVSSVMGAGLILVLEDGRITGAGRHEELLERRPIYRDICQSQMGDLD